MSTGRYFGGHRNDGKRSVASEMIRLELQKKGKLPSAERYKLILKRKFEDSKKKAMQEKIGGFRLPTSLKEARRMSARAEKALQEIAAKKAAKEAKALRKMVIITPRIFPNGRVTQKGQIYDIAGNLVAEVNKKNGKMSTMGGWSIGKYKPKSYFTDLAMQGAIDKYSPYYINLRKMQAMQQGTIYNQPAQEVINIYGHAPAHQEQQAPSFFGFESMGPRQAIGVTSWGARSDNVWGTFADNAWGNSADNVWGTNSTDVWGGIGVGGLWGGKGIHVWGTGNGKNYIKGITNALAALFGIKNKGTTEKLKAYRSAVRSSGGTNRSSTATMRSGGGGRR